MEFTGERFVPDMGLDAEIEIEHFLRYSSICKFVQGKTVLDAASGSGYGTSLLADYAVSSFGLEIGGEAVEFAANKYEKDNLKYVQGSIANIPFLNNFFDVVVSFETIEHVNSGIQEQFLEEIKRVLQENGTLIISTPDKKIYSDVPEFKNQHHIKEFYRQEFHDFLKRYFSNVVFFEQLSQLCHLLADKKSNSVALTEFTPEFRDGKYIIAVCSDAKLGGTDSIAHMHFDQNDEHQKKLLRITQLQEEVYERNEHIKLLDSIVSQNNVTIKGLLSGISLNRQLLIEQDKLAKQNKELLFIKEELKNAQSLILKLKDENNHIKGSKAWKLIQMIYNLKNKLT